MKLYTSTGTLTAAVAYTYDGLDRLLARKLDANGDGTYETTERFVYDSAPGKGGLDDTVLMLDGSGNVVRRVLNGPLVDQVFAEEDGSGVTNWLLTDNLGSTRDVARYDAGTATTSVADSLDYNAFGKVITETSTANTPLTKYTGRYRDPLTGDQFHRARWYDTDGIWLRRDPKGFEAGDTNLYRYVGNSPTNATDPSGLAPSGGYFTDDNGNQYRPGTPPPTSKLFWQNRADEGIGYKIGDPTDAETVMERNRRITALYAEMYLRDPGKFLWAGMAAYASYSVLKAMSQACAMRDPLVAGSLFGAGMMLDGTPTGTEILESLEKGNIAIFRDIYWQHLAYSEGGIEEMKRLLDREELTPDLYDAWKLIDEGKVWDGNQALLYFEQLYPVQHATYGPYSDVYDYISSRSVSFPWLISIDSPIPGDNIDFQRCVPGGNLGNFNDRWKWITKSMLPAWKKLIRDNPGLIDRDMKDFTKNRYIAN